MTTSPLPVDGKQCVDLNTFMNSFGDWTLRTEVTYSSFYALIFLVGLIGNGLLIRTIRRRMSVANVFLLNLAISDLLLCITALPITPVLAFVKQWIFGSVLCKLVPLCQGISVLSRSVLISSYCLCFIALDRFRSIVTPLKMPWDFPSRHPISGSDCHHDVRQDWLVPANSSSTMTVEQQAATVLRKRRVMYVLILMVLIFMGSWMPLTIVNLLRDMDILRDANNMYFKLLNVHAVAMTSIVSNPLLYFWMSKRHRRALRDDINWFTNARRQQQQNVGGLLNKFTPSPSIGLLYRKNVERHLLQNAAAKYNQQRHVIRGTLGDPTCISRERALQEMHANW
ncbi:hypothetical protein GPALN_010698 [Globodera pallida]|nr:hypothetical protein GPALN_010698 [Globodera pallida]